MSSPSIVVAKLPKNHQIVTEAMVGEQLQSFFNWENNKKHVTEYSIDKASIDMVRIALSQDPWWQDISFLNDSEFPYYLMALLLDESVSLDFFTTLMELYYFVAEHGDVGVAPFLDDENNFTHAWHLWVLSLPMMPAVAILGQLPWTIN